MLVWNGLGFLVFVIAFGFSFVANLITDALMGEGYYDENNWLVAIPLVPSAVACWFLGNALRKRADRVVIDKETGEELTISRSRHTMFFVPMHWWAPILIVLALGLLGDEFLW